LLFRHVRHGRAPVPASLSLQEVKNVFLTSLPPGFGQAIACYRGRSYLKKAGQNRRLVELVSAFLRRAHDAINSPFAAPKVSPLSIY